MKVFAAALLDHLASKADASPRGRAHHNIHSSASDPVQRFFVVANQQSYFRPHRHLSKSELVLVLRGGFDVITFADDGEITSRHAVGEHMAGLGYETPRNTWHTLIANAEGSAFLEVKEGPYDPVTASEFAPWSLAEGDASVPELLQWLRVAQVGERFDSKSSISRDT